jgi:2-dehydro-3-deoxyphosphooctonate aldolase (KDO 8-P synthase)
LPVLTDIHERVSRRRRRRRCRYSAAASVFARQTDLVEAMAKTGRIINIKKAAVSVPRRCEMGHILNKCEAAGNDQLMLCERGSSFGYNNLVVDMLGFRCHEAAFGDTPLFFDVTHALQMPGGGQIPLMAVAVRCAGSGASRHVAGLAGLFLESHPEPDKAKCDGPCALPLDQVLSQFLESNAGGRSIWSSRCRLSATINSK